MAALNRRLLFHGIVTTTDAATQTTVAATDTIPDGSTVLVMVHVLGRNTSNGAVASSIQTVPAKRVSGTLSIVGSQVVILTFAAGSDAALNTSTLTIDASSNTIRARVNGVAATTIDWVARIELLIN